MTGGYHEVKITFGYQGQLGSGEQQPLTGVDLTSHGWNGEAWIPRFQIPKQ
jgi:hypothetical protein